MQTRAGACAVCSSVCLDAMRDERVYTAATGNWVEIRHCTVCGAYWDMQPASRPVVISHEEALRRVPDPANWTDPPRTGSGDVR